MTNLLKALGVSLAAIAIGTATGASAQTVPMGGGSGPQQSTSIPPGTPEYAMLAERVAPCATPNEPQRCADPRPARPSTIDGTTPTITPQQFVRDYPQAGMRGYLIIARANADLCEVAKSAMEDISQLDQLFVRVDNEYQTLMDIYNALPRDLRNNLIVTTVAQAAATGALCALSSGLYCIAVAVGAISNIFTGVTNRNIQMASIRLAIANIALTRLNIHSNRITLRLDSIWLVPYSQACQQLGYIIDTTMAPLPPVPQLPANFGRR